MFDKLKIIGLISLAALCVSAMAASAAQANPQFHVESAPTAIKGEQVGTQVFQTPSWSISCGVATFHGTSSVTTTTTQTLGAEYRECGAFGFPNVTVDMNGCNYLFHLTANTVLPYTATVDVVCPLAAAIEITGPFTCVTKVFPQTGKTGVTLTNNGTKTTRDLKVGLNVTGIHGESNPNCPEPGTFTEGKLTGEATVRAYTGGGAQQGLWVA
jgi:hypothetical protein